jgi:maltose O-acetyltransferase
MVYFLVNVFLAILPPTRCFLIKRIFLRLAGVKLGARTKVCGRVKFYGGGQVSIGSDCWIGIGASFFTAVGANIFIGDRCDIAPEVSFICGSHEIGDRSRRAGPGLSRDIVIGNGAWLGTRSIMLGGLKLGDSSVVGAATLLLDKEYPPDFVIVGVPGRLLRPIHNDEDRKSDDLV